MKVLRISAVAAMLTCCCMIHTSTSAEQFPSRVVKFLVPQAAGGATDVFARKLAQMLSERWGQPIIVENHAGAAGVLGTDVVAKSAADGYTLLVTYAGSQAVNPSLYPNLPFDSVKDFQPIATLARTPFLLVVNPKLPAKDLREFIALARQKPGILTFASSGIGSVNHLLGEMLKVQAGINILHAPLPRRGAGDCRRHCTSCRQRLQQRALRAREHWRRASAGPRGQQCQARRCCARRADHRRIRLSRLRRQSMVGHSRARPDGHGRGPQG
jgi:tripartite-type tricarboxylate transporter receptor subunit TctC